MLPRRLDRNSRALTLVTERPTDPSAAPPKRHSRQCEKVLALDRAVQSLERAREELAACLWSGSEAVIDFRIAQLRTARAVFQERLVEYKNHYGSCPTRKPKTESHPVGNLIPSLRGGGGVFYDLASSEVLNNDIYFYPFQNVALYYGLPFPTPLQYLAVTAAVPPNPAQGAQGGFGVLASFDPNLRLPYTLQWSASAEQSLGKAQTLKLSYVGSSGRRLLAGERVTDPNPNYPAAYLVSNAGNSSYNALQIQLQRSLAAGLQMLASYTWSHSIDTGSYGAYKDGLFANVNANRGDSDFDIRNSFSLALTYNIPTLRGNAFTRGIFGGWSTENIVHVQSASPVTVIDGAFAALTEQNASILIRPDLVPGQPLYLYGSQYPGGKALNPSAFTNPPVDPATGLPIRQGDLPRNALRGFGLTQWDFAVRRDFPIREALKLQFRAEMFNVLNHPNFVPYNNTFGVNDPYFGQSTAMANQGGNFGGTGGAGGLISQYQLGGPRSVQLAMKLVF